METKNLSDLELIQAAARSVGFRWSKDPEITHDGLWIVAPAEHINTYWNPLKHDADAFRLAIMLAISITPHPVFGPKKTSAVAKRYRMSDLIRESALEADEPYGDDPMAATRRAIVRCAAAIGGGAVRHTN